MISKPEPTNKYLSMAIQFHCMILSECYIFYKNMKEYFYLTTYPITFTANLDS